MRKQKSIMFVFLTKLYWFFSFIVIISLVNLLSLFIKNEIFQEIVKFTNQSILIIILMAIIFFLGELFEILRFPFNLLYPLFNATGAIFMISFIQKILALISNIVNEPMIVITDKFIPFVSTIVFIIVIISGYIEIFISLIKRNLDTR
ncbi:MAG TPA: hypothetical protein PLX15_01270 [Candidatus Woesearchaeota archaeon]|nr:hypothetical protein [Candidatus Woesearchaeota archaeon]